MLQTTIMASVWCTRTFRWIWDTARLASARVADLPYLRASTMPMLYILQTPETFVIQGVNGYRVIPLDGRAHLSANLHEWQGNGVGHWEGDTLVGWTPPFSGPTRLPRGANPKTLKITERFTRVSPEAVEYKYTIDDPSTWTKPWSVILPLSAESGPLFEFACSEDDYDAVNILAGARAIEKKAKRRQQESQFRRNSQVEPLTSTAMCKGGGSGPRIDS